MVDALVECNEAGSCTTFLVTADNILVNDGKLTEAGLTENIAQTAAAGTGYKHQLLKEAVPVGYIGAIKNLEVFDLPDVGDTLETTVSIQNKVFDVTIIAGTVKCNGKLIAQCEMKIFINNNN